MPAQIRPFPSVPGTGEQEPRAVAPQYQQPASGDFGQARATELTAASRDLDRAATSFGTVAATLQADATETRAQELNNEFIDRQQQLLSTGDDAFYRLKGADAIAGAEQATERLQEIRAEILERDSLPPPVAKRLAPLLDLHLNAASNGIARHVARESMTWQTNVLAGRRDVLHRQAAIDAGDPAQIRTLALIGQDLAREKARQDGLAGSEAEAALVTDYRSAVLRTAIDASIARNDNDAATRLFDRFNKALSATDRAQLERSIGTLKVNGTARTFAASVPPPALDDASDEGPPGFANFTQQRAAADRWHEDAKTRNETEFARDPVQFAANKQAIDARHAIAKRALALEEKKLRGEIETWTMQPGPDGTDRVQRPPPTLWNKLSYAQQQSVDAALVHNARGEDASWTPDAAATYARLNDLALADPPSFAREDLHAYVPLLPKARLAELLSLRSSIEQDGRAPYAFDTARTLTRRALTQNGINPDPALVGEIDAHITDWAASFEAGQKRKPTDADVREKIDDLAAEYGLEEAGDDVLVGDNGAEPVTSESGDDQRTAESETQLGEARPRTAIDEDRNSPVGARPDQESTGRDRKPNPQLYRELLLQVRDDPEGFRKRDLVPLASELPDADWKHFQEMQVKMGPPMTQEEAQRAHVERLWKISMPWVRSALDYFDPFYGVSKAEPSFAKNFMEALQKDVHTFEKENKRQPSDDEILKMTQRLLMPGLLRGKRWYELDKAMLFQGDSTHEFYIPYGKIPEASRQAIEGELKASGKPHGKRDVENLYTAYRKGGGKEAYEPSPPASPSLPLPPPIRLAPP